jgi:hypothetical protein
MTQPPRHASTEERLVAVLSHIQAMEVALRYLQHDLVQLVNSLGVTWDTIGEAHDPPISRQAARKRYSHPKPRRTR